MVDRGDLVIKAKLAEQAERYEGMYFHIKVFNNNNCEIKKIN